MRGANLCSKLEEIHIKDMALLNATGVNPGVKIISDANTMNSNEASGTLQEILRLFSSLSDEEKRSALDLLKSNAHQ